MAIPPYFIYLDTKIIGAVKQTITFFEHGVFPRENTIILVKKYKHKSAKIIERALNKASLNYHFVNAAYLDALKEGVIFYPFNAQSNCRAVANRNLTHIFITHGESNKITSVKPIVRIYDHVITAGNAGIDRLIAHKIFSQYDVEAGRIIPMGDTFIGKTGLDHTGKGIPAIFYVPTWEGGIEQENYSSLSYVGQVTNTLHLLSKHYQINEIVIRPHPNTGHRLQNYHQFLMDIVKTLLHKGLKVTLYKPHVGLTFSQAWKLRRNGGTLTSDLSKFYAIIGLCDISAIESQLLNENIFYYLFCSKAQKEYLISLKNSQYYKTNTLTFGEKLYFHHISKDDFYQLRNYMIEQNYLNIPLNQRIEQLLAKLNQL